MKFYYQLIVTIKQIRDVLSLFEIKTRKIQEFFASYWRTIARTIQLLTRDTYCPITLSY